MLPYGRLLASPAQVLRQSVVSGLLKTSAVARWRQKKLSSMPLGAMAAPWRMAGAQKALWQPQRPGGSLGHETSYLCEGEAVAASAWMHPWVSAVGSIGSAVSQNETFERRAVPSAGEEARPGPPLLH